MSKPEGTYTAIRVGFPPPITVERLGKPVGVAAIGTTATRSPARGYWIWAGIVLGTFFPLVLAAGFVIRRRHRPAASPSTPSA